jgi:toxin FitB
LIEANCGPALAPPEATIRNLPAILAAAGVVGGAVYDAMVGLAAKAAGHRLVTRGARAIETCAALGVEIEIIGG